MGQKKISFVQLEQLVREGNGVSQIARKIGVTKGAVSKALKKLNVAISKDVTLRSAPQIVEKKIDAMQQLINVNQLINSELDYIERHIKTAPKKARLELQDQKLKHVAEVRKQVALFLDIARSLYNAEEVAAFQKIVLEEIGHESPETKARILQRLNERRAARSTLSLS